MRKRLLILLAAVFLLAGLVGVSQAELVTIGTASYLDSDYNLIYDDDDNGHGGGGLVWLDYTYNKANWSGMSAWAAGLGSQLTVTLKPGYTTDIDWTTGWRLPDTVDGPYVYGYEDDLDGDGVYNYTGGYNLANSEMGHLYYTELDNLGRIDTSGDVQPGCGLENTGDFEHLIRYGYYYWSGTEYEAISDNAWLFSMSTGVQDYGHENYSQYGLAVHSGQVVPVPGAIWLFGSGLIGLATLGSRKKGNRV